MWDTYPKKWLFAHRHHHFSETSEVGWSPTRANISGCGNLFSPTLSDVIISWCWFIYTNTWDKSYIYIYIHIYIYIYIYIYILKNNSHKGSAPTSGWLLYRTVFRKFPYPKIPHWSFRKVPVANKPACLQETFLGHLGIFFGPRGDHGELYRWDRFVETRSLVGINVSIYIYIV